MSDSKKGIPTWVKVLIGLVVGVGLLIICGFFAIMLGITTVAINPAKNFESARNTQRSSDISVIATAISQYNTGVDQDLDTLLAEAGYNIPLVLCDGSPSTIGAHIVSNTNDPETVDNPAYLDLGDVLVGEYLSGIPGDPANSMDASDGGLYTSYFVCRTVDGRIQVFAPYSEPLDGNEPMGSSTDLYVEK